MYMQESGLSKIIPSRCTLITQAQYPAFLHPESPVGAYWVGCRAEGSAVRSPFASIFSSFRAHCSGGGSVCWLHQPMLTDMANNIFY